MKKPIANKSIIKSAKPTRKALGDVKNVNRGQELLESLAKVHSQQISDDSKYNRSILFISSILKFFSE